MNKKLLLTLTLSLINVGLMAMAGDVENAQLFNAVRHDDVAGVQAAIEQHADVNARSANGNTPLHMAVLIPDSKTRKEIITLLVRNGARVDLPNNAGQLPADLARMTPEFEDIQELLGVGGCPVCLEDIAPKDDFVRGSELFGCDPRHIAHRICLFDSAGRRLTVTCPTCRATRDEHAAHTQREALLFHHFVQQETAAPAPYVQTQAELNAALLQAASNGNLVQVQTLLAQGADVNAHGQGGLTALMVAARDGHTEVVTVLLAHPGIDVNVRIEGGWTSLTLAVQNGHIAIVAALLAHSDIDVNVPLDDNPLGPPLTVLSIAWLGQCREIVTGQRTEILTMLLARSEIAINERLSVAASIGNMTLIQTLLDQGANINAQDEHGITPLMAAAHSDHAEVVTALLARPEIDINTRLMVAAYSGNLAWTQTLLKQGAHVNAHGAEGYTALIEAARMGHTEIVTALLAHPDIDVNARDGHGDTALTLAAHIGRDAVVTALLAHPGIDVNIHGFFGKTVLMHCAGSNRKEIVRVLVIYPGIDINACDIFGRTALTDARETRGADIIRLLIEHGAR